MVDWLVALPPGELAAIADDDLRLLAAAFGFTHRDTETTTATVDHSARELARLRHLPDQPAALAHLLKGDTLKALAHALHVSTRGNKLDLAASIIGRRRSIVARLDAVAASWWEPVE